MGATIANLSIQAYDKRDTIFEKTLENQDTVVENESESEDIVRFFAEKQCFELDCTSPYLVISVKDVYNKAQGSNNTYDVALTLQFEVEEEN